MSHLHDRDLKHDRLKNCRIDQDWTICDRSQAMRDPYRIRNGPPRDLNRKNRIRSSRTIRVTQMNLNPYCRSAS